MRFTWFHFAKVHAVANCLCIVCDELLTCFKKDKLPPANQPTEPKNEQTNERTTCIRTATITSRTKDNKFANENFYENSSTAPKALLYR